MLLKHFSSCLAVFVSAGIVSAEVIKSASLDPAPVTSVAIFTNGMVTLSRQITPKANVSIIKTTDNPFYGTFIHNAKSPLNVLCTQVTLQREALAQDGFSLWSQKYTDCDAQVVFRGDTSLATILSSTTAQPSLRVKVFTTTSTNETVFTLSGHVLSNKNDNLVSFDGLVLRLASGAMVSIPENLIVAVQTPDAGKSVYEYDVPVWKLVGPSDPYNIIYTMAGAVWRPFYTFQIGENNTADLLMSAELKNSHCDWNDVDVTVVAGVPTMAFPNSRSWLSKNESLVAGGGSLGMNSMRGVRMYKSSLNDTRASYAAMQMAEPEAFDRGEIEAVGTDVNYQSLGKMSLKKNDVLLFPMGAQRLTFKRLVETDIFDTRDIHGDRMNRKDQSSRDVWDVIEFTNPFKMPLSNGSIEIREFGHMLGQAAINWTNPQEEVKVRVTKAPSITCSYMEEGDSTIVNSQLGAINPKATIYYANDTWRRQGVLATITFKNNRSEPTHVRFNRSIVGEPVTMKDLEPTQKRLLPMTNGSPNPEYRLTFEFDLQPGEMKKVTQLHWLWVR